jgi:hypothetical protein
MSKKIFTTFEYAIAIVLLAVVLGGCNNQTPPATLTPPEANLILNPNISDVLAGQTVALSVEASGQSLQFKWSVSRGNLSASDTPTVIYTAPSTSGVDTVAVEISSASGTITKSVSFNVTVPVTDTVEPTSIPTNTPLPPPLEEIFPLIDGGGDFVFINNGGVLTPKIIPTQNCIHSGVYGLQLTYEMKDQGNGGWGINWDKSPSKHFDASGFNALTFWVKGATGGETFQIGLKDTSGKEAKKESVNLVVVSSDWMNATALFSDFEGVNVASLQNVNFGFNKNHGSGSICVDDMAFVIVP